MGWYFYLKNRYINNFSIFIILLMNLVILSMGFKIKNLMFHRQREKKHIFISDFFLKNKIESY
jgi:hypothetical protein